MATARRQIVAWERRWFVPVGLTAFAAAILLIVSVIVFGSLVNNGHSSDFLVSAHEHGGTIWLYAVLQAIGFLLMMPPLYFLFRATAVRSDRFRRQMVGVVIAAPIFFAIASILSGAVYSSSADKFVNNDVPAKMTTAEAKEECASELKDKGAQKFGEEWDERERGESATAACERIELEDDRAEQSIAKSGMQGLAFGFGLAARIGLAAALLYTCLYAMRVGLLSRFWGSLGMALGVASLLLRPEFALIFFLYFGLLAIGKLPGGRPPAWAAGEAVPWPTPGEKAAQELQPEDPSAEVVEAPELPTGDDEAPAADGGDSGAAPGGGDPGSPRRKRKRRG